MEKKFHEKCLVLVVPSKDFEWVEYDVVRNILEDAGCEIFIASDNPIEAVANNSQSIAVDGGLPEIDVSKYDGIFFIGGPGTISCLDTPHAYRLVKEAKSMDIAYGAIDLAVRVLAHANGLVGKAATGLNTDGQLEAILTTHGARYRKAATKKKPDIIVDKGVITAEDSRDAQAFAQGILKLLEEKEKGIVQHPLPKRW